MPVNEKHSTTHNPDLTPLATVGFSLGIGPGFDKRGDTMKQGRALTELAQEIERAENAKKDLIADTRQLAMSATESGIRLNIGGQESTGITDYAHGQIAERIKIPRQYYRRMQSEAPQLLTTNVNHWFLDKPERRMVRTLDGDTRAFLSDRYRPLDNFDLLTAILPILADVPDMKVESCETTDRRMYIKALFPRQQMEVKKGDVVQSGIVISNSEIGAGSLRVEPLVFRLICLNGMIGGSALKKYHVGRGYDVNGDGSMEIFRDATMEADDKAFWMKTQDTVRAALDDAAFRRLVGSMQEAMEVTIDADPVVVVERTAKKFSLTDGERGDVLRHLIQGGDLSQYGLMNAITRTSQDVQDYDRATDLERLGGVVIELPKRDWHVLAQAS